ncbi:MAG: cation transporter, partial [Desulfatiglandales bacterium]|nr:cation transporter [Desulfatiglandales bacterium]
MLLEEPDGANPHSFKETELFRKCQEIGIIPGSGSSPPSAQSIDDPRKSEESGRETSVESALSLTLKVNRMWCPACAWVIEEAMKRNRGIVDATCNFSTDRVRCDYNPVLTSPAQIIRYIESLGYRASVTGEEAKSQE